MLSPLSILITKWPAPLYSYTQCMPVRDILFPWRFCSRGKIRTEDFILCLFSVSLIGTENIFLGEMCFYFLSKTAEYDLLSTSWILIYFRVKRKREKKGRTAENGLFLGKLMHTSILPWKLIYAENVPHKHNLKPLWYRDKSKYKCNAQIFKPGSCNQMTHDPRRLILIQPTKFYNNNLMRIKIIQIDMKA